MTYSETGKAIESLAIEIGEKIYIDIAKWHLFLREAHLHMTLAEYLYPLVEKDDISEQGVTNALKSISVSLGGGKRELPLLDLIPSSGVRDLVDILEEFQRNL